METNFKLFKRSGQLLVLIFEDTDPLTQPTQIIRR
jgi:hypothetical protein